MTADKIAAVLAAHKAWLDNEPGGKRADLRGADLRGADLRRADLIWADPSGANLIWADLSGARGPFVTGYFGRHHAIAAGGYISIGCVRHTYADWLRDYAAIGAKHDYTPAQIEIYGAWIRLAVKTLEPELLTSQEPAA